MTNEVADKLAAIEAWMDLLDEHLRRITNRLDDIDGKLVVLPGLGYGGVVRSAHDGD